MKSREQKHKIPTYIFKAYMMLIDGFQVLELPTEMNVYKWH